MRSCRVGCTRVALELTLPAPMFVPLVHVLCGSRTGAFDEAFGDGASLGAMGKAILHRANGSGRPGDAASAPIAPAAAWGQQSHHFGKGTPAQRKASRIMRSGRRLSGKHVMLEWWVWGWCALLVQFAVP